MPCIYYDYCADDDDDDDEDKDGAYHKGSVCTYCEFCEVWNVIRATESNKIE